MRCKSKFVAGLIIPVWAVSIFAKEERILKGTAHDITRSVEISSTRASLNDYHYNSLGRPNPFIPPMIDNLIAKIAIPIESNLQRYPLSKFSIVGIWTLRNSEIKAMVQSPNGEGNIVVLGTKIGQRGGVVTQIDEKSITVREFSLNTDGSRQYEDYRIWMEDPAVKMQQENNVIKSDTLARPNDYGYGKKNYYGSKTYEKFHQEILDRLSQIEKTGAESTADVPLINLSSPTTNPTGTVNGVTTGGSVNTSTAPGSINTGAGNKNNNTMFNLSNGDGTVKIPLSEKDINKLMERNAKMSKKIEE